MRDRMVRFANRRAHQMTLLKYLIIVGIMILTSVASGLLGPAWPGWPFSVPDPGDRSLDQCRRGDDRPPGPADHAPLETRRLRTGDRL